MKILNRSNPIAAISPQKQSPVAPAPTTAPEVSSQNSFQKAQQSSQQQLQSSTSTPRGGGNVKHLEAIARTMTASDHKAIKKDRANDEIVVMRGGQIDSKSEFIDLQGAIRSNNSHISVYDADTEQMYDVFSYQGNQSHLQLSDETLSEGFSLELEPISTQEQKERMQHRSKGGVVLSLLEKSLTATDSAFELKLKPGAQAFLKAHPEYLAELIQINGNPVDTALNFDPDGRAAYNDLMDELEGFEIIEFTPEGISELEQDTHFNLAKLFESGFDEFKSFLSDAYNRDTPDNFNYGLWNSVRDYNGLDEQWRGH